MLAQAVLVLGLLAVGSNGDQAPAVQVSDRIELVGRLLDEDLQPIPCAEVGLSEWRFASNGTTTTSIRYCEVQVASDREGRFTHALAREPDGLTALKRSTHQRQEVDSPGSLRAVQFRWEGLETFEVELPQDLPEGPVDLGDIQLVRPGSIRWLAAKNDAALAAEYQSAVAAREHYEDHARAVEACLTEIARRAGPSWEAFLVDELARERAKALPSTIHDLALLTALRRVQGKRDPLALQLVGSPELECHIDQPLTVSLRLRNVDVDGEAFHVTFEERSKGFHFPPSPPMRFAVEALDASGQRLPSIPLEPIGGSFSFERGAFEHGGQLNFELTLDRFVHWPGAGEYQVRIHFHEIDEIAKAADPFGWITSTSTWFTVHVFGQRSK